MKKIKSLAKRGYAITLILMLALSLAACGGNSNTPSGGDSTPSNTADSTPAAPGTLTLAALKKAADDKGYTEYSGTSTVSNEDDTLPEPADGFTIGIKDDKGSTGFNIAVNEFASEDEAGEYAGYIEYRGGFGNVHLSGKFTAVFIGDEAESAESDLMAAFQKAGWSEDSIPTYTPPEVGHSEAIQSLMQAVQDLGFETRDDYMTGFSATIKPVDGFTATFRGTNSASDIPFFEFKDNAEALAYKAENDKPEDFFPKEHVVAGKFAAEFSSLSEASGAECKKFIGSVYEKAGGASGAPGEAVQGGGAFSNLKPQGGASGAALTNFDISFTVEAQGQETYTFRQASSEKGTFTEEKGRSHDITYLDFGKKTGYELNADEKYGESFPLEPVEMYKGFAPFVKNHLLMHESYKDDMKKTGSEKLLGRDATVYTAAFSGGEMKLWVDDEYGITLKYEQTGSNPAKMNVTGFTVGGVTVEGMVNLGEYEIG